MISRITDSVRILIIEFQDYIEETAWLMSDERKEIASLRLKAHRLALQKNYPSPYTNPDAYDSGWNYIYPPNEST